MKNYKKISIILLIAAVLLGISGYSIYETFLKSEDVTSEINTNEKPQNINVKDIKIKGFTYVKGFYDNKLIGEIYKEPKSAICVYDIKNNKLEYIEKDKMKEYDQWGHAVSPDGKSFLYQILKMEKNSPLVCSIKLYNTMNKQKKIIDNLSGEYVYWNSNPWSENGRYSVVTSAMANGKVLYMLVYDMKTGQKTKVNMGNYKDEDISGLQPKVSNDGKKIFYLKLLKKKISKTQKRYSGCYAMYSMDVNNGKDVKKEDNSMMSSYFYVTPSDKSIIYSKVGEKKDANIIQRFIKSNEKHTLIKNSYLFSISPNGKRISYIVVNRDELCGSSLYTADIMYNNDKIVVKNKKFIYKANFDDDPVWSSDNKSISVKYNKGVYIFNLN